VPSALAPGDRALGGSLAGARTCARSTHREDVGASDGRTRKVDMRGSAWHDAREQQDA